MKRVNKTGARFRIFFKNGKMALVALNKLAFDLAWNSKMLPCDVYPDVVTYYENVLTHTLEDLRQSGYFITNPNYIK